MTDVQWIYAEGLGVGAEIAAKSMREADAANEALFAENEAISA